MKKLDAILRDAIKTINCACRLAVFKKIPNWYSVTRSVTEIKFCMYFDFLAL